MTDDSHHLQRRDTGESVPRTMAPSLARVVAAIIDATPRKTRQQHPTEVTHERRGILARLWHGR